MKHLILIILFAFFVFNCSTDSSKENFTIVVTNKTSELISDIQIIFLNETSGTHEIQAIDPNSHIVITYPDYPEGQYDVVCGIDTAMFYERSIFLSSQIATRDSIFILKRDSKIEIEIIRP